MITLLCEMELQTWPAELGYKKLPCFSEHWFLACKRSIAIDNSGIRNPQLRGRGYKPRPAEGIYFHDKAILYNRSKQLIINGKRLTKILDVITVICFVKTK